MNSKSKLCFSIACLILGVILGLTYTFLKPIFIVSTFSIIIGIVLWLFTRKEERRFIVGIYFVALFIRLMATTLLVGMMFFNPMREDNSGALSGDEHIYMRRAIELSKFGIDNIQKGTVVTSFGKEQGGFGINIISLMSAIFYSVFGFSLFALKILSCIVGALTTVIVYYLARHIFNIKVAKLASILVAFNPSLIRWSAQMIKEPFIILLILVIFLCIFNMNKRRLYLLIGIAVSLLMLYSLQSSIVVILLFSFLVVLLPQLLLKKISFLKLLIFILSFFMLVAYGFKSSGLRSRVNKALFAVVIRQYSLSTAGKSAYSLYPYYFPDKKDPNMDFNPTHYPPVFYRHILPPNDVIGTPLIYKGSLIKHKVFYGSFILTYFQGLLYVIFSPFPWSISTGLQLQAYPQIIFNYFLLPFVAIGILLCIRYRFKDTFLIIFSFFCILSLLAISEGNVGALFRHRDWIMSLILMFGAAGLVKVFDPSGIYLINGNNRING